MLTYHALHVLCTCNLSAVILITELMYFTHAQSGRCYVDNGMEMLRDKTFGSDVSSPISIHGLDTMNFFK